MRTVVLLKCEQYAAGGRIFTRNKPVTLSDDDLVEHLLKVTDSRGDFNMFSEVRPKVTVTAGGESTTEDTTEDATTGNGGTMLREQAEAMTTVQLRKELESMKVATPKNGGKEALVSLYLSTIESDTGSEGSDEVAV